MTTAEGESLSLVALFDAGEATIRKLKNGDRSEIETGIRQSIRSLELATKLASIASLFSRNEMLDDLPTGSLRFLLLPAYLGYLIEQMPSDPSHRFTVRIKQLVTAGLYYADFLSRCRDYGIPGCENLTERQEDNEDTTRPEARRQARIERFRRDKLLAERIAHLEHRSESANADDDADERLRDVYVARLEMWILSVINDQSQISEELRMLRHMAQQPESAETAPSRDGIDPRQAAVSLAENIRFQWTPIRLLRAEARQAVFGSPYPSMPLYTIEDYYDSLARTGALPDAPPTTTTDRTPEMKKIDEEKLTEGDDLEFLAKQRSWDDFKDDNKRGSGNMHRKG